MCQIDILAFEVFKILRFHRQGGFVKLTECCQHVADTDQITERLYKCCLSVLIGQIIHGIRRLHDCKQVRCCCFKLGKVFIVAANDDLFTGVLVGKQGNGIICCLFQITETDNVPLGLFKVQDAVCSRKRLDQTVLLQVFVDI